MSEQVDKLQTARRQGAVPHGVRELGCLDIAGGGQVFVRDGYAYIGHMTPPDGVSVVDVRDPERPKVVATVPPPSEYSHTHKVRVVGNLMVINVERHRRHFYRRGAPLPEVESRLRKELGREPTDVEAAHELGMSAADMPELRAGLARGYEDGGFRIFDISDPTTPQELAYQKTGGVGVHRFDMDERYAYISTEAEGFRGNILIIYDLAEPSRRQEVPRWWMPGQNVAAGEAPHWRGVRRRVHHGLRHGDRLWVSCWHAGAWVVDISDIHNPRTLGTYEYHPPFPEPTHTFLKMPQKLDGREIALVGDEQHDYIKGQPPAFLWIMDVSDPANIKPLSTFHVSPLDTPYAGAGGRFGLHQFQEHVEDSLIYAAWFSGGLRIIDVADPSRPREVGSYVPAPLGQEPPPQSNDVDVDEQGLIYLLDRNRGLHILEY